MDQPRYLRLAALIRRQIVTGELAAGTRLPARQDLAAEHGVAEGVVREAIRQLAQEGHVVSRPGAGVFVRERPTARRIVRSWYRERRAGSPFAAALLEQGSRGGWMYESATIQAPPEVRTRLALDEPSGDASDVMHTRYVFTGDDQPWMLSDSYEPLSLTKGTIAAFPEDGPLAGRGVTHRMAEIGVLVDDWVEDVTARPAAPGEAKALGIAPGSIVLTVARTYLADGRPVEVADIVIPAETSVLGYSGPVGDRVEEWADISAR
ncbi:GntR family transcriptional regulator [Streptosporangium sp. NBC_01755]|uniref:GntR family transcriptional regulator n=1 Tax=Streptosporangium sp. NBC_01755 TaxID=2975949 RepID=UPI002DDAD85D|nr:GntR family transcriptional regulator [Streptosporangium sp. NBC_01755]WSD03900.1 GntR family transcriptional regulator [Streptosporangium sp. NBC_01755]